MTRGLPPRDHDGCYVLHLLSRPLIRCRIPVVEVDNSFTIVFNLCVVTAIDDDVDDDSGGGLLMLTRADFFEASAINTLICSFFLFSPSYTTLEIKVAFKASESVGKSFKEKTLESFKVKSFYSVDGYRLNLWGSAIMEPSIGLNAMDDYTLITLLLVRIIAHKN